MNQYLLIAFLEGMNIQLNSYFDVNRRGTIGFDPLPYRIYSIWIIASDTDTGSGPSSLRWRPAPGLPSSFEARWLMVWSMFSIFPYFPYIGNVIIPPDSHIFQRVGIPPIRVYIDYMVIWYRVIQNIAHIVRGFFPLIWLLQMVIFKNSISEPDMEFMGVIIIHCDWMVLWREGLHQQALRHTVGRVRDQSCGIKPSIQIGLTNNWSLDPYVIDQIYVIHNI